MALRSTGSGKIMAEFPPRRGKTAAESLQGRLLNTPTQASIRSPFHNYRFSSDRVSVLSETGRTLSTRTAMARDVPCMTPEARASSRRA
jgi:hypothetical protein